ncbi:hypothetical protein, partial [Aquiflexum sp.]|uniref:hypothetical protein n=1 Tax=Aquiflexum sp. TaxID=1872584 RepID=UPI00359400C9
LIDIAANMEALFPSQEMELRSTQNQMELLKRQIKRNLTYQQRKELNEVLESAIRFFDSPRLESWDIGERFYFLILNSEVEDLQPIINPKLARLNEEELEQVAGNLFIGRLDEDNTLGQCESIEFCFQIIWDLLPERIIKRLICKVEDILISCTEDELVIGTELVRSVGGLGYLSENILGKMLESYFTDQEVEDLLETPDIMKTMILDLKKFGVQYLPEAHYEVASQVFLDFYINYPGIPLRDKVENVDEAVHFIPELLKRCKLEFLEYFNFQILKFEVQESKKYRIEKLNDLKGIINRRKDFVGEERGD